MCINLTLCRQNPLTSGREYTYFKLVTHIYSLFAARLPKIQLSLRSLITSTSLQNCNFFFDVVYTQLL